MNVDDMRMQEDDSGAHDIRGEGGGGGQRQRHQQQNNGSTSGAQSIPDDEPALDGYAR